MATKKPTFAELKEKISHLEDQLRLAIDMADKDTVTKFQLIGWCSAAFVLGIIVHAVLF